MFETSPSLLTVTTPATDLNLLTMPELRASVGVTDRSADAQLRRIGARISDAITQACAIGADGATPPTLRQETLTETFRLNRWFGRRDHLSNRQTLVLARRPIVSITSVTEAGTLLDPSLYEVRAAAGTLERLFNDAPATWAWNRIDVVYVAGWAIVPEGLKRAAEKLAKIYWEESSRDSLLRVEDIPGVARREYWIGAPGDPSIPRDVMDDLGPYRNLVVG